MAENTRAQQIVARLASIRDTIDVLTDEKTDLEAQLAEYFGAGTHEVGDVRVTVRTGTRRFDAKRFEMAFPPDEHPGYYKPTPNLDVIKNHLAPADLEPFKGEESKGSVSIK